MTKIFYDQDGNKWNYDCESDTTDCKLYYDYHIVEEDIIHLCLEDGEVVDSFKLENINSEPIINLLCIDDKGVFNIVKGNKYISNGEIIHNGIIRNICLINDMNEYSYYNIDRFKIVK